MNPYIWIGWYLVIGIAIDIFVPKPPKAAEAFRMGAEVHPAGRVLGMLLVAIFWPLILVGMVRRFF